MQLVLTESGSSAPGPEVLRVDFSNARALLGICPAFPWSPVSPPLGKASSSHQKEATRKARTATV